MKKFKIDPELQVGVSRLLYLDYSQTFIAGDAKTAEKNFVEILTKYGTGIEELLKIVDDVVA
jgi:hypothetical protein